MKKYDIVNDSEVKENLDYCIDKGKKQYNSLRCYITDVKKYGSSPENKKLEVKLSDGSIIRNINYNESNCRKVNEHLESQARLGLLNSEHEKNLIHKNSIEGIRDTTISLTATLAGTIIGYAMDVSLGSNMGRDLLAIPIYGGVISISIGLINLAQIHNCKLKIKELNKIEYRNDNRELLNSFRDYKNSLDGLSKKKIKFFSNDDDPLSLINIDKYTINDLKVIVSNIEKEKQLKHKKSFI